MLGATRLSASWARAAPRAAATSAEQRARAPAGSVRTAGPEQEAGREAAAPHVGPEPAPQRVLQLESGPEIRAGRLLVLAADLERELEIEEQPRAEVAARGQGEPAGRILADLEHVEAEPLAGRVRDRARQGAERDLLPGVAAAVRRWPSNSGLSDAGRPVTM